MTTTVLPPRVSEIEAWATMLVDRVMTERGIETVQYARDYFDDGNKIMVLLKHRDSKPGIRGSEPGKPNFEVVIDRATQKIERVSVAR